MKQVFAIALLSVAANAMCPWSPKERRASSEQASEECKNVRYNIVRPQTAEFAGLDGKKKLETVKELLTAHQDSEARKAISTLINGPLKAFVPQDQAHEFYTYSLANMRIYLENEQAIKNAQIKEDKELVTKHTPENQDDEVIYNENGDKKKYSELTPEEIKFYTNAQETKAVADAAQEATDAKAALDAFIPEDKDAELVVYVSKEDKEGVVTYVPEFTTKTEDDTVTETETGRKSSWNNMTEGPAGEQQTYLKAMKAQSESGSSAWVVILIILIIIVALILVYYFMCTSDEEDEECLA